MIEEERVKEEFVLSTGKAVPAAGKLTKKTPRLLPA